jgi:ectoine hydroxylase-related dioxygenase (phytanoyl-CoA dioxygenase family)
MVPAVSCVKDPDWIEVALSGLRDLGACVITDVLDAGMIAETEAALYRAQGAVIEAVGRERLERAGELGVVRLPMLYERHFLRFLELEPVRAIVDRTVSETAILHLQNGFVYPSFAADAQPRVFQNRFHRDFPRLLNGYMASVNLFFAISEFTEDAGGTHVAPGTHQKDGPMSEAYLERIAQPVVCPAGSIIAFDSTLMHRAGFNRSGRDRLSINHQFTRSFFKQQIDYPRALAEEDLSAFSERCRQMLGFYTRVPASLDDYYRSPEERLYRSGQG